METFTNDPRQINSRSHASPCKNDSNAINSKPTLSSNMKTSDYSELDKESSSTDSLDSYLHDDSCKPSPSTDIYSKVKRPAPPVPSQNLKAKIEQMNISSQAKIMPEKSQGDPTVRRMSKQKTLHERLSYHYGDDVSMPVETDIDSVMDSIPNDLSHPHHPVRITNSKEKFKILPEIVPELSNSSNDVTPPTTISPKNIFIPPKETDSTLLVCNPNRQREIASLTKCSDALLQTLVIVTEETRSNAGFVHSRGRDIYEEVLKDLPDLSYIIKEFTSNLRQLLEKPEREQEVSKPLHQLLKNYSPFQQYILHLQKLMYNSKNNEIEDGSTNTLNVLYKGVQLPLVAALQLIPPWLATVLEHAKSILLYTSEAHPDKESLTNVVQSFIQRYRNDSDTASVSGLENDSCDPTPFQPRLLKHSLLIELTDSKQRQLRVVFLFEDVLICAKPRIAPRTVSASSSPTAPSQAGSISQGVTPTGNYMLPKSRISQVLGYWGQKNEHKETPNPDTSSHTDHSSPHAIKYATLQSSPSEYLKFTESTSPSYHIHQFDVKWFIPTVSLVVYKSQYVETAEERNKREEVTEAYKQKIKESKKEVSQLEKRLAALPKDQLPFFWKNTLYKSREKLMKLRAELVKIPPHVHFVVGQDNKPQKHFLMSSDEEVLQWSTAIDKLQRLRRHNRCASYGSLSSVPALFLKDEAFNSNLGERTLSFIESIQMTSPVLTKTLLYRRLNAYRNTLALNNIGHYLLENEEGMSGCLETKVHYVDNLTQEADYTVTILVDSHGHLQKNTTIVPALKTMRPTWDEVYEVELDNSTCILFCLYARYPDSDSFVYVNRLELQLQEDALQDYMCRLHTVQFPTDEIHTAPKEPLLICISLRYITPKVLLARKPSMVKNSLFNVPLVKVLKWDMRHNVREGNIPFLVRACLADVEKRGLKEEGIYRQSGPQDDRLKLKILFEKETSLADIDLSAFDVHSVTGFVKYFFRELPEPLFTAAKYSSIVTITGTSDVEERYEKVRLLVNDLVEPNKEVLRYFLDHLLKVIQSAAVNRMNETSLAIILASTLITPSTVSSVELIERSKPLVTFLEAVLKLHQLSNLFIE